MKSYLLLILFVFPVFTALSQDFVLTHVHVLSMDNEEVLKNQAIVVSEGKIVEIVPVAEVGAEGIERIDGKGAYVFPGLAEFHAHLPVAGDGSTQLQEESMWLYLANGVLRIRSMLGHASHLQLRDRVNSGETPGPRVYITGPSFNGNSVDSPESARQMVREQQAAGYDHLKLHPGLDTPRFLAIADEAKKVGIPYGGHVSLDVGIETSLQNGYKSVEHMDGYLEGMIEDKSRLDPQIGGPFNMLLVKEVDRTKLPELIRMTLDHKAWVAPTLTLFDRYFGYIPADEFKKAPEMKYLPGPLIQQWVNTKKQLEASGVLAEEKVKPYLEFRRMLFMELHRAGVPMIMSSDSPQVFNVPGFSIHHEINLMAEAGMSNYEILKTGSVNPSRYMDQEDKWGRVKPGLAADFVLVERNPLEDLTTMQRPLAVCIGGKMISRQKLQEELDRIETNHKRK